MAKVAFLGLGVMGYPMAGHLKTKGHDVTICNRTAAKAEKWVEQFGGHRAPAPSEAAKGQEFVFACVGNDDDLRAVTTGADRLREPREIGGLRRSQPRRLSRASLTRLRKHKDLASSMPRYPAARPAPRQVRSASCAAACRTITRGPKESSFPMPRPAG